MKKIIALKGRSDAGKSETVKKAYDLLLKKYPNAIVNNIKPKTNDIKIIMDINGVKVGIESQGDPNARLKKSLEDFVAAGCEIIICATRTSGMTVDWVKAYANQYKIEFVKQTYVDTSKQAASNLKMANLLITRVNL